MTTTDHHTTAVVEADADVPLIHITRDFHATPERVIAAHTDPELFARWCGPDSLSTRIDGWDARTGGSWSFTNLDAAGEEYSFHGSFHEVTEDRIVQTFTFDGWPEAVSLETLRVEDLGDGWTRLRSQSLYDSFEGRAAMLESDMETGVQEGYRKLDALLAA